MAFPGAIEPNAFWHNILARADQAREPPPGRWILAPTEALAEGVRPDQVYSLRGCFVDPLTVAPSGLDVDHCLLEQLDPLYHLVLHAGRAAFADAVTDSLDRQRVGVVLAAIALPTDAASAITRAVFGRAIEAAVLGRAESPSAVDPANARVVGWPAALLAQALRLGGGGYTLDAACASSLYALKLACEELKAGRAEAMLAGGVSRPDCLYTQMGFCQLRAMSRRGRCAPFDESSDGLLVGEGAGLVMLKRLDDALRDGDRIYGTIRGIGLSNDIGGSLLAPDSEGQLRAMRQAYDQSGWSPTDVDLIECHGTGTPLGDAVEIASLRTLWDQQRRTSAACPIGSVKSNIGHLLTAAGAAGLIKTLLAMQAGTLPPSANYERPNPVIPLEGGPFHVQTTPQAWPRRTPETPRRAAVNAFGFGGINAHVLLEEWLPTAAAGPYPASARPTLATVGDRESQEPIAIVGLEARFGKLDSVNRLQEAILEGRSAIGPRPVDRWRHADDEVRTLLGGQDPPGAYLPGLSIPVGRYRLPPNEIPEVLPQQMLMLEAAHAAVHDAGLSCDHPQPRIGVFIGMALDFSTTECHLRWWLRGRVRRWAEALGSPLGDHDLLRWLGAMQEAAAPAMTATRVVGALGNILASRIAREFRLGGPSFAVAAEELSGLRALEIAVRSLQRGELDAAVVGAVDLAGDARNIWASRSWRKWSNDGDVRPFDVEAGGTSVGEGAAALVLKRLRDARHDGDRVYAVVKGMGFASTARGGSLAETGEAAIRRACDDAGVRPGAIGYIETHGSGDPVEDEAELASLRAVFTEESSAPALGSIVPTIGHAGAASGLAAVVKACLCLDAGVLPPLSGCRRPRPGLSQGTAGFGLLTGRKPWLPRRDPRLAGVSSKTPDGECMHVILEEAPEELRITTGPALRAPTPAPESARCIEVPIGGQMGLFSRPDQFDSAPREMPGTTETPAAAEASTGRAMRCAAGGLAAELARTAEATAQAHGAFLRFSEEAAQAATAAYALRANLAASLQGGGSDLFQLARPPTESLPQGGTDAAAGVRFHADRGVRASRTTSTVAFDRPLCLEFARGLLAPVLGEDFAVVDSYPVRVRLPDEPLMLVDRILSIDGAAKSLTSGRIVTEHDVRAGAWYLDAGRCPISITVEAGQADLFLCSYLGIDLAVQGRRAYRLLDAMVTFHRHLPRPGEVMRYDIHIDRFVRQGETYLFFFRFDGTVDGEPVLSMRDGCAGFFTAAEITQSGGLVLAPEDTAPAKGRSPDDWRPPVRMVKRSFDDRAVAALRAGDLETCFGDDFAGLRLPETLRLPGGRMRLFDRILELDPTGGRFGLGSIRAESDIHYDDWFLTCHFVDDMTMPGTLMYDCCMHTLRFLLLRMGWVVDASGAGYEPVPGVQSILKCRGPVTPKTRKVIYEVELKEIGFRPEPYVLADALMYADGRRIVRMVDMSLRMPSVTREAVDTFWQQRSQGRSQGRPPVPSRPLYDKRSLLAFATGRPSETFGERYRVFDEQRRIARLPAPPYDFVDRITAIEPAPWVLQPGGWVEAEFDVRPDAWYFRANRQDSMPYCALLEAALQPCGFLAAYLGSALRGETDLSFRNLEGRAVQHAEVFPEAGPLTMRVRLTHVSEAGGMIIEKFDLRVLRRGSLVYEGETAFGFFSRSALAQQVGLRDARERAWSPAPEVLAAASPRRLPDVPPLTPDDPEDGRECGALLPTTALRMIDQVDVLLPNGGPHGLGYICGSASVRPGAWFFKAHFHQDPVWPGSLGLESFLQLLKVYALARWPHLTATHRFEPIAIGIKHSWAYRGQILPTNRRVDVEVVITRCEEQPSPLIIGSGFLRVDDVYIYEMRDFGIRLVPDDFSAKRGQA